MNGLVLRWLLLHVIDNQNRHRVFLQCQLQAKFLFDGFEYAKSP